MDLLSTLMAAPGVGIIMQEAPEPPGWELVVFGSHIALPLPALRNIALSEKQNN